MEAKERTWVKLKSNDVWKPNKKGEFLEGIFVRTEESTFQQRKTTGYVIDTQKTGDAEDDEVKVYGVALKKLMKLIQAGTFVRIVYQGSKNLGGYKNLKLYDVLVDETDAPEGCYEYVEEGTEESNGLMESDDPEARGEIEHIIAVIGPHAKAVDIVKYAEENQEDLELGPDEITRIKIQAAKMYKEGK